jgi:hypothetical protein
MSSQTFLVILSAGAALSVAMAIFRFLRSDFFRSRPSAIYRSPFSPPFSWFAVPLPFCIGWIVVTFDWVRLVLFWR